MLNTKKIIDTYFASSWVHGDIQFEGTVIPLPSKPFIATSFTKIDRSIIGFGGDKTSKRDTGMYTVRCYADSPTTVYDLEALVLDFLECKELNGVSVGVGVAQGNGAINLDNGLWETTTNFKTQNFKG